MNNAELKSFGKPEKVREFPKGRVDLLKVGGATVGRATFEPGWRWSTSVQPIAKTKSCEAPHFQYHVSGVLMVLMDDGTDSSASPATSRICHQATMPGSWETNRRSSSISRA
jgi:hypothetical protein